MLSLKLRALHNNSSSTEKEQRTHTSGDWNQQVLTYAVPASPILFIPN